jgi:phosphoglycolate phosphatase-like HAD superfamily hydrolase
MLCYEAVHRFPVMRIALDFDGTIVGCEARQMSVLSAVSTRMGIRVDLRSVWKHKRDGLNTRDSLISTGIPSDQSAMLQSAWVAEIESPGWLSLDQLLPGVRDVLCAWSISGHHLTLLSARSRSEWLACQVRNLGIRGYFDNVVCVDPLRAVEQKTKALKGLHADHFVGDTESDYESASAASVEFTAVSSGQRSRDYLKAKGCTSIVDTVASENFRLKIGVP